MRHTTPKRDYSITAIYRFQHRTENLNQSAVSPQCRRQHSISIALFLQKLKSLHQTLKG